jgi:hypothetical protein
MKLRSKLKYKAKIKGRSENFYLLYSYLELETKYLISNALDHQQLTGLRLLDLDGKLIV